MGGVKFLRCDMFAETAAEKTRAYPKLASKIAEFFKLKFQSPLQQFGSSDKPFKNEGNFTSHVPGLRHAHLTHDIMIVYTISGRDPTLFKLYGIFSHDELGIGQPANIKIQKNMARRMSNQNFYENLRNRAVN